MALIKERLYDQWVEMTIEDNERGKMINSVHNLIKQDTFAEVYLIIYYFDSFFVIFYVGF